MSGTKGPASIDWRDWRDHAGLVERERDELRAALRQCVEALGALVHDDLHSPGNLDRAHKALAVAGPLVEGLDPAKPAKTGA